MVCPSPIQIGIYRYFRVQNVHTSESQEDNAALHPDHERYEKNDELGDNKNDTCGAKVKLSLYQEEERGPHSIGIVAHLEHD